MANYKKTFQGNFDDILAFCNRTLIDGSASLTEEESCDYTIEGCRTAVRVYERYSMIGENRVSMTLVLSGYQNRLHIFIATTGGSQAVFWKINTWGEESFLDTLAGPLDNYINRNMGDY